jgi:hypothetical protein
MRTIKNEEILKMITEMRSLKLSFAGIAEIISIEALRLGGYKRISGERVRQIYCGLSNLGAGSVLYEKAIKAAHKRLCK